MFNGSRFFNLAKKWKEEGKDSTYFFILEDVMVHYFGTIAGYRDKHHLIINGDYPHSDIAIVLDSVGYSNYSIIKDNNPFDKIIVILRNSL